MGSLAPLTFEFSYDEISFTRTAQCGENEVVTSATTSFSNPGVRLSWSEGTFTVSGTFQKVFPKSTWTYLPGLGSKPIEPKPVVVPVKTYSTLAIRDNSGLLVNFGNNDTEIFSGQSIIISGTPYGDGSIFGYTNPSTYFISATNGWYSMRLLTKKDGDPITTTPGIIAGLTLTIKETNTVIISELALLDKFIMLTQSEKARSIEISDEHFSNLSTAATTSTDLTLTSIPTSTTLSNVVINTVGSFSCNPIGTNFKIGQKITISGALTGSGFIDNYINSTSYFVVDLVADVAFQLSSIENGEPIITTPGTSTGLVFTIDIDTTATTDTTTTAMPVASLTPVTVDDFTKVPANIAGLIESTHETGIFKPITYTVHTKEKITTVTETTSTDADGNEVTTTHTTITYENHTYTINHKVCNNWDIYKSQLKELMKRGSL